MTIICSWSGEFDNTYCTLTEADSILATTVIDYSAWTSATVPQRESSLHMAARDIDGLQYIGTRYNYNQRLEFPRRYDRNFPWNYTYTTTILGDPEQVRMQHQVKTACALQALFLLRQPGGRNIHLENQIAGVSNWSETVGPLSVSINYGAGGGVSGRSAEARLDPTVLSLLADWKTTRRVYRA